jgi:hypothetical protein
MVSWWACHEAPAPIGQEAQPAKAGRSCEAAEAMTTRGAGSGPRPDFVSEMIGVPRAFGVGHKFCPWSSRAGTAHAHPGT